MGFTRAPETPLEGRRASKSNACPRAGKGQGDSCPVPCQNPPSSCCAWVFFPGWSLHLDPGRWSFSWDVRPKSQNLQWSLEESLDKRCEGTAGGQSLAGRDAEHLAAGRRLWSSSSPALLPSHAPVLPFFNNSIITLNSCYYQSPQASASSHRWLRTQANIGMLPFPVRVSASTCPIPGRISLLCAFLPRNTRLVS